MAPGTKDPDNLPGLAWRICEKFGVVALIAIGMLVVMGYVGRIGIEQGVVPLVQVVAENLQAQTTQLAEQTKLLATIAKQSDATAEFRLATGEVHKTQNVLLQSIQDGQIRLEEQNRQLILEMRTVGEGIREMLRSDPTKTRPDAGSTSSG